MPQKKPQLLNYEDKTTQLCLSAYFPIILNNLKLKNWKYH